MTQQASANTKPVSILFMVPSPPGISPGQRFRFEQYLPFLDEQGIRYKVRSYLSFRGRNVLYSRGNIIGKALVMFAGILRRFRDMFTVLGYEYIYIHRWATIAGPPVFEWFIAKVLRKKIIYDFDDAIWVAESHYNNKFLAVKFLGKVGKICKWSYKVSVGNSYLREMAVKHNQSVVVVPTVVNTDTVHYGLQNQSALMPAVGWTGSFSTLPYLTSVVPALQRLQEKYNFTFYVIADKDPQLPLKNYSFVRWSSDTETYDLMKFHIGLMPLPDDEITRGKCGFKAIQYMALGIPALVSPVGVNTEIVDDGLNGYVCSTETDWEDKIGRLLADAGQREKMGIAARRKIEAHYSVSSTKELFFSLFS